MKKKIIVAITGASGAVLGIRLLQLLKTAGAETHLVISSWGKRTIEMETDYSVQEVTELADCLYDSEDLSASIASGSFRFDAMVVAPCSMKTLAAIYAGLSENLITRAADVCIKERRQLILLPRETPLSPIHLRNMQYLSELGITIVPPVMTFYTKPDTVVDMIDQLLLKVLDQLDVDCLAGSRWGDALDDSATKRGKN